MEEKNFDYLRELIEKGDFSLLRHELSEMNEVDIAEFLGELDHDVMLRVFRILPKDISAEVFSYLESEDQGDIISRITDTEINKLVDDLFLDDVVDLVEEVPANLVTRILKNASPETRRLINTYLNYPEESAGSIMTNEMVELHDRLTVGQAIEQIRRTGVDKETIYTCYCIDNSRHLKGTIDLADLVFHDNDALLRDIMDDDKQLIFVKTTDDQEEVAEVVKHYDLLAVPVVDTENRLVGIVTIDDILDIIEEETEEDFEKMAALLPSEDEYLKTPVHILVKNRIGWLLVLMISATLTGSIIQNFEDMLAVITGLTAAIPIITGTGGNAGNQSSTLAIRALALGEIELKDWFKVLFKEIRVAAICGVILGAANFLRMVVLHNPGGMQVYIIVSLAMFCAVLMAKMIGCMLPLLAKLVKIDPAVIAGPVISTMVDSLSLLVYFALAKAFLLR
ncbi:MAG: magnesium transporter [Clostridia bacterium]|jgi:magnesium transporter|nr:magnesium transporter [Clostridia bacterium]MBQ1895378.1 magnesium transporter [Clostridia bacterium]MBQ2500382.1 magnesium transporter [Clostridia bacterium]MBQ6752777.1 magnesium transporter [Clostridia bacterium]